MNSADKVNRELARLDSELRAGGIDRASFRAQRRRLLLDYEERETTTQPAAVTPSGTGMGSETTLVDPPVEVVPFVPPEPAPAAARGDVPPSKKSAAGIVVYAIGAILVLALAGWWFTRPKSDAPARLPSLATSTGATAPASIAGADTPQSLAAALTVSTWTDADVTEFLARWKQLSPEAIQAASEDSRVWLLRGETGRRLREARETESIEQSSDARARVEQLEMVQNAIGTP